MIKVGFDAKRYFHNKTGLGNYSRDLVRILHTQFPDNEYHLFNPKKSSRIISSDKIIEHQPTGFWKRLPSIWRIWGCKVQIKQLGLDVFHGLSGELPWNVESLGVKTVVTVHDLIFLRFPHLYTPIDRFFYLYKTKNAVRNADGVIAISEQTKQDLVDYLGVAPQKIKVIYQGCAGAFKKGYTDIEINRVKAKFNLPNSFLLNVGTIEPRKNALTIIKAVRDIDTKLVIVGKKTSYQKELDEFVAKNNIQHKIMYLQGLSLEELAIVYQMATIFMYPSIFEGFGIPIIEALYAKTPVITTSGGVFPEAGGPDSCYVNPYDAKEMADAIKVLLETPKKRDAMASKGWEYVQKFNDDVIAAELMAYYESLLT